jgi:hypothetical protein
MDETKDIVMSVRVPKRLHDKIVDEQARVAKLTGMRPSLNEVARMFMERGMAKRR